MGNELVVDMDEQGDITSLKQNSYAVSFTTIPQRIPHIHHVVDSWLQQDGVVPSFIFVFVPAQYKRFKRKPGKSSHGSSDSFSCMAEIHLAHSFPASPRVRVHRACGDANATSIHAQADTVIRVEEVKEDWGPATKYVGFLEYVSDWAKRTTGGEHVPAFWVVGDDDVAYKADTLSLYEASRETGLPVEGQDSLVEVTPNTVLSHFSSDYRQVLKLHGEPFKRPVVHVQGVDTVLFPTSLIEAHRQGSCQQAPSGRSLPCTLCCTQVKRALRFLHGVCPSTFYQDDYVVSLLANLGNVDVRSVFSLHLDNVAKHVDGVSKQYSQMHMNAKVLLRETEARNCLEATVEELIEVLSWQEPENNK